MTDEWPPRRKSTSGDASMRRSIQDLTFSTDPNIKIEPEIEDVRQLLSSDLVPHAFSPFSQSSQMADPKVNPPEWVIQGRQFNILQVRFLFTSFTAAR